MTTVTSVSFPFSVVPFQFIPKRPLEITVTVFENEYFTLKKAQKKKKAASKQKKSKKEEDDEEAVFL